MPPLYSRPVVCLFDQLFKLASCQAIFCEHLFAWRFQGWCNFLFVYSSFKVELLSTSPPRRTQPGPGRERGSEGSRERKRNGESKGRERERERETACERERERERENDRDRDRHSTRASGTTRARAGGHLSFTVCCTDRGLRRQMPVTDPPPLAHCLAPPTPLHPPSPSPDPGSPVALPPVCRAHRAALPSPGRCSLRGRGPAPQTGPAGFERPLEPSRREREGETERKRKRRSEGKGEEKEVRDRKK